MAEEKKGLFDKAKDAVSDKVDKEKAWDKAKEQGDKHIGEDDGKDKKSKDDK